jgi:hypothetical protein
VTPDEISEFLLEAARLLAEGLSSDIALCATREEHIRISSRANAAAALYNGMLTTVKEVKA